MIAEISNAALVLQSGDEFQQFKPTGGIALVQVSELPDDRVQVVITGVDATPSATVSTAATGLTLSVVPIILSAALVIAGGCGMRSVPLVESEIVSSPPHYLLGMKPQEYSL